MISKLDLTNMRKQADHEMQSAWGQSVRLEWQTRSGGTSKPAFETTTGGTLTRNVLDTSALIVSIRYNELKLMDNQIVQANPAIIKIKTDINLSTRPNFVIAQKLDTEYWTGTGVGAAAIWTPGTHPRWTTDQWKGFWLWFSDKRFEILSNTTLALTVSLGGDTLPTASTTGEIVAVKVWYPNFNEPSLADGMRQLLGSGQLMQSILATEKPIRGDQI